MILSSVEKTSITARDRKKKKRQLALASLLAFLLLLVSAYLYSAQYIAI